MRNARQAIAWYRAHFQPSASLPRPYAMLAVTAVCAETDDEAHRLFGPLRLAVVRNRTGRRAPIATVEEAERHVFTGQEAAIADEFLMGAVVGSRATVRAGLQALANDVGADELMISALIGDAAERRASFTRIAEAAVD